MKEEKVVVAANGIDIASPPGATLLVMRGRSTWVPACAGTGLD